MIERLKKQLENVPYFGKDADEELSYLAKTRADAFDVSSKERVRLNEELEFIKKSGIAKVILFALDAVKSVREDCKIILHENYLYIHYLLGLTDVNPVKYNLPRERFFNEHRYLLPEYCFYVKEGNVGKILNRLYMLYGENHFIKGVDNKATYFISQKDLTDSDIVKETIINAKLNEETYKENISYLKRSELYGLSYYSFSIIEYHSCDSLEKDFTEEEIYLKCKELFGFIEREPFPFTEILEITEILKHTENVIYFQEQVIEFFTKICGVSLLEADFLRRELCKRKRCSFGEVTKILNEKYGEKGEKILEYFFENGKYSIMKGHVIALLYSNVKYENIF